MELGTQRYQSAETRAVVALIQNQLKAEWRSIVYWHNVAIALFRGTFWRKSWIGGPLRDLIFEVTWPERCAVLPLAEGRALITLPDGQTVLHHALPEPWLMYVDASWRESYIEAMKQKEPL